MSIRERVVDEFTRVLLSDKGMQVSFSFGHPVVVTEDLRESCPASHYYLSRELAVQLYEALLRRMDFSRLALEARGAWLASEPPISEEFGEDLQRTGRALRAAMTTLDTDPDYQQAMKASKP